MQPCLAVHGGAFSRPASTDPALRAAWRHGLHEALRAGATVLEGGGSACDAVVAAVAAMEAGGVFNAGRAAVMAADGERHLDAAIMDGARSTAGAVAAVRGIRHPVRAARAVLDDGRHVILAGEGAARFALAAGCDAAPADWFVDFEAPEVIQPARDTVGAVARDVQGRLAAATSTGGLRGKLPGRVGDSPLPGAGTWADTRVAVSCTGLGECFIRTGAAHRLACLVEFGGLDLAAAAAAALRRVTDLGGDGGCIVMPATGTPVLALAAPGMARGTWEGGVRRVAIDGDESLA
jgi:L-asparaginase / beta-aspartyl-peptidase